MKFTVTCLVSSVNSSLLPAGEAVTKEITVANPKATVQNLRATVAIQFRLNVMAFDFRFDHHHGSAGATDDDASAPASASPSQPTGARAAAVDFHDEKRQLTECGLQEGDHLTVLPKNYAPAAESAAVADVAGPDMKRARLEGESPIDAPAMLDDGDASASDDDGDEEEEASDDSDSDVDGEASGQSDLFDALREVVPDLTVLRQEFLANPQGVMERIERDHPSLFQVIVQNQMTFITLMNNEQLTKAAQGMLHGGLASGGEEDEEGEGSLEWSMGEEDEEVDEETAEQMNALFQSYISAAAANGDAGDFNAADLAALEASGMQVEDVQDDGDEGDGAAARQSDKDFILARVTSEEDEKKIQSLTELGFTYEQCKLAFYMCHRSIDRASNMLFEAPPQV